MSSKGCKKVNSKFENQTCNKIFCVDLHARKRKKLRILTDLTLGFLSELYFTCIMLYKVRLRSDIQSLVFVFFVFNV